MRAIREGFADDVRLRIWVVARSIVGVKDFKEPVT